ncbi:hypothetical protein RZS08_32030, partial [Arthrospira platensis SPKY1]|nr:hypothetical protein [Arthrospira platensis SPKY1]
GLQEKAVHVGTAAVGLQRPHVLAQRAPEHRLPAHGLGHRRAAAARQRHHVLARRPVGQPVGPVDLVLVEQVGHPLRQLEAPPAVAVVGHETAQRCKRLLRHQRGQQTHQAPQQQRAVVGRHRGHALGAQHGAVGVPDETGRQQRLQR